MSSDRLSARVSVRRLLVVIFLARTILNVAYRAVYPFLPFIASDLGVSLDSAAQIIQSRNLVGLSAPLFGPLSDRYGRRNIMILGLSIPIFASLALGLINSFAFAILAIAIITVGKILYDPAQQAYVGDVVPYASRGRIISLSETSWSAAALIGLPFFGIIVHYAGWRAGFVTLGAIGVLGLIITAVGLPSDAHHVTAARPGLVGMFNQVVREPSALAVLLTSLLLTASNENVNVVFGAWMNQAFLLDAVALGTVASAIGLAELAAELFSSGFVDRIGKHRLVRASLFFTGAAYVLLPFMNANPLFATLGLVLVFFLFELTIVSMLALITEIVPSARGTLLSLNLAIALLGRTLGSFTGPFVFVNAGFVMNGLLSGLGMSLAFLAWHLLVREHH